MSGRWTLKEEKHNHIKFSFQDNSDIYFNDARNFGSIKFGQEKEKLEALSKLGPDPLKTKISFPLIEPLLPKNNPTIGHLLLDQSIFNGTGNYLRAEILYAALIDPFRRINNLSRQEWDTICTEINTMTNLSYQNGGATIRSYKNLTGERGKFSERFLVYGRKQDPNNNQVIRQIDDSKRAIWYVPFLQK